MSSDKSKRLSYEEFISNSRVSSNDSNNVPVQHVSFQNKYTPESTQQSTHKRQPSTEISTAKRVSISEFDNTSVTNLYGTNNNMPHNKSYYTTAAQRLSMQESMSNPSSKRHSYVESTASTPPMSAMSSKLKKRHSSYISRSGTNRDSIFSGDHSNLFVLSIDKEKRKHSGDSDETDASVTIAEEGKDGLSVDHNVVLPVGPAPTSPIPYAVSPIPSAAATLRNSVAADSGATGNAAQYRPGRGKFTNLMESFYNREQVESPKEMSAPAFEPLQLPSQQQQQHSRVNRSVSAGTYASNEFSSDEDASDDQSDRFSFQQSMRYEEGKVSDEEEEFFDELEFEDEESYNSKDDIAEHLLKNYSQHALKDNGLLNSSSGTGSMRGNGSGSDGDLYSAPGSGSDGVTKRKSNLFNTLFKDAVIA
ncbi:unnamed protein product [Ambrosiozyma monospora]|uniref:Unnamed protein product n=1 Tax=Ambrosiozyma monospora TaxID=43982 RepID=A0ACB5T9E5_AMBMO|nr:unnamed protein product [Ambrosiozyma monospora]